MWYRCISRQKGQTHSSCTQAEWRRAQKDRSVCVCVYVRGTSCYAAQPNLAQTRRSEPPLGSSNPARSRRGPPLPPPPPPPFPPPSWLYAEQDAGMTDCNFTSAPFCRVAYVPAKTPLKPPTHSARLLCGSFVTEYRQKSDMNRDAQVSQKPGSPSFQPLPRSFPALIHGNSYLVSASVHVVTRPTRPDVGNFVLHNPLSL